MPVNLISKTKDLRLVLKLKAKIVNGLPIPDGILEEIVFVDGKATVTDAQAEQIQKLTGLIKSGEVRLATAEEIQDAV